MLAGRRLVILIFILCAFTAAAPLRAQDTFQQEASRLATLLEWRSGSVVADIGAGKGQLTVAAAEHVGPSGKVYTTELDPQELDHLKELAKQHANITAVEAGEADTNLPPACCDSIFMRLVYHHLTKPDAMDASIFRALKPGGRLAVIDEIPSKGSTVPPGVPENRGGHGIPQEILIHEVTAAGFTVEKIENNWMAGDAYHQIFCVVFPKK